MDVQKKNEKKTHNFEPEISLIFLKMMQPVNFTSLYVSVIRTYVRRFHSDIQYLTNKYHFFGI